MYSIGHNSLEFGSESESKSMKRKIRKQKKYVRLFMYEIECICTESERFSLFFSVCLIFLFLRNENLKRFHFTRVDYFDVIKYSLKSIYIWLARVFCLQICLFERRKKNFFQYNLKSDNFPYKNAYWFLYLFQSVHL